ncbi:LOW QUALITY PROTEIN: hypothetical protein PHMEG_00023966 [Phytophthora megakarya]|uniref:Uncharacterized protein n=1 Tax=Phytophthora megakarya TaxID=4795 RepID=A0A225VFM7_9STRA|nr:LOW QUALITY PROTEIN: hypothetical protein PHMEG_00023966 [Phytophthora megakarya]
MLTGLKLIRRRQEIFSFQSRSLFHWTMRGGHKNCDGVGQLRLRLRKDLVSEPMTEELGSMDFAQNVAQFKWDRIVLPSLRQFHKVHGHTDVPRNFVVPKNETWPKLAWGRRLGLTVGQMRCTNHHAEQMAKSKAEWRSWVSATKSFRRSKFIARYLDTVSLDKNLKFRVVTHGPKTRGEFLLEMLYVRMKRSYAEQSARDKASLEAIDFAWDRDATMFAKIFKHGKVPSNFVVPSEDPWPKAAWSLKLGVILCSLRSKGTYLKYFSRDAEMLDALGVPLKLSSRAWQLRIVPLIDIYANLYSDEGIPEDFVIPPEEPWPEEVWGVRLWLLVHRCAGATNEMPQN